MRRILMVFAGVVMAVSLAACTPTTPKSPTGETRTGAPAGVENQTTVDGAAEKLGFTGDPDEPPSVVVCVYTVKDDKSGLKQNIDAIDGEAMDAQRLLDKMAELGVVEEGINVQNFEQKNGVLTMDLSALKDAGDNQVLTAVGNTFIQNFDAEALKLTVNGKAVSDKDLVYVKEYKTLGE